LSNTALLCEVWGRRYANHQAPPSAPPEWRESSRGMNLHMSVYFNVTPNTLTIYGGQINPWKAASFHPGGVNVSFADGSVHFVTDAVSKPVFQAMASRAGGEVWTMP
jgi:prepilin-type processing-associated H-X9-DG protein